LLERWVFRASTIRQRRARPTQPDHDSDPVRSNHDRASMLSMSINRPRRATGSPWKA